MTARSVLSSVLSSVISRWPARLPSPVRSTAMSWRRGGGVARVLAAASLCIGLSTPLMAQSAFSPAVLVADRVVTYYEIEQRALLLTLMNAPGDTYKLAREQLINERLQLQAAETQGVMPSEEGIQDGIKRFGQRANMDPDQLVKALAKEGVSEETLRDFVFANMAWQGVIQTRYGGRVQITEQEIDRAIASNSGAGSLNVLLSEIVIPITPQTVDQVHALAFQLSQITTEADFAAAAKQYSQSKTKDDGGRLDWLSITKLPAELRPIIMSLGIGDVSAPVKLPNAMALFRMRSKRETSVPAPHYSAIDYAAYLIPGGHSPETEAVAADLRGRIDVCDDLYAEAKDKPEGYLQRMVQKPGAVPRDYALELSKLDDGEVSTTLTRQTADGRQALVFLMLCGRTAELGEEISREDVAASLRGQRLESFAAGYLAQLRADSTIVEK